MQRSWNGCQSSSWAKLSRCKTALNRWIRTEICQNKKPASPSLPDWWEILQPDLIENCEQNCWSDRAFLWQPLESILSVQVSVLGGFVIVVVIMRVSYVGSEHYSRSILRDSDLILPANGELVVVRCPANERWYRASVIGRDLEHNIKVACCFTSFLKFYFIALFFKFYIIF